VLRVAIKRDSNDQRPMVTITHGNQDHWGKMQDVQRTESDSTPLRAPPTRNQPITQRENEKENRV
jgi:hypothetical protein